MSILQQTNVTGADDDSLPAAAALSTEKGETPASRTVLEEVIDKATSRSELSREVALLSTGLNSPAPLGGVKALRALKHERLQRKLFLLDKDARLRSGARGLQARKALQAFEKTVAESAAALEQQDEASISAEDVERETQEAIDMLEDLKLQVDPGRMAETEARARKILTGLGFSEAYMIRAASSLSGGWRMRSSLATALLAERTDILILDEPTNFLDLFGIIWLSRHLRSLSDRSPDDAPTLVLVSHDRDFVTDICTDLLIIRDKQIESFHGSLPAYEAARAERRIALTKMKDAQDKQKAHIQQTITQNIKVGRAKDDEHRIRQAKSRQKKLDDRWGMQVNAKGHRFSVNKDMMGYHFTSREQIEIPAEERDASITLPVPPELRFPGSLISLDNVSYRYPGRPPPPLVLEDVTLSISMGDRVAILGLNGAGKSTLIKVLVGSAAPTKGTVATHPRLRLGYYGQHAVEELQSLASSSGPPLTALSLLARDIAASPDPDPPDEGDLRALLGCLGLPGGRLVSDVPLSRLSGGQLVRVALARVLWRRPHVLVLDEPTTHLDYGAVRALRAALTQWDGAVVLVSHDRWFVRGVVEGGGEEGIEEEDGSTDGEDDVLRRRTVYALRKGKLVVLEGGVAEFEKGVEKKVRKLLGE